MSPVIKEVSTKFSLISLLKEMARKFIHVGACLTALILIGKHWWVLELAFLPVMALGFYISEKIAFFGKNISFGNRRKWGGILLVLGFSLVMVAPVEYEVKKFAVLTLMIADVAAAIVGKTIPFKKVEILGAYKSIGGSLAFAVGVLVALSLSFPADSLGTWKVALIIPLMEVVEFLNWRGVDNLSLPIVALVFGSILF
jgi:dolichol kinase